MGVMNKVDVGGDDINVYFKCVVYNYFVVCKVDLGNCVVCVWCIVGVDWCNNDVLGNVVIFWGY